MTEASAIEPKVEGNKGKNLLKTIPGLLVSAFFIWYTFFPHGKVLILPAGRGISIAEIRALRIVEPIWVAGVLGFTLASLYLALRSMDANDAEYRRKVWRLCARSHDFSGGE